MCTNSTTTTTTNNNNNGIVRETAGSMSAPATGSKSRNHQAVPQQGRSAESTVLLLFPFVIISMNIIFALSPSCFK